MTTSDQAELDARMRRIDAHPRLIGKLWTLSNTDPSERKRDAAERATRDYREWLRSPGRERWATQEVASKSDSELAELTKQAKVWLTHERAARATGLYLVIVAENDPSWYDGKDARLARALLRICQSEATARVAKYKAGIKLLGRIGR